MMNRPETGPMQFGDDWRGVFLRGDNAGYYALLLKQKLDGTGDEMTDLQLRSLLSVLQSSNHFAECEVQREVQRMKPFDEAKAGAE